MRIASEIQALQVSDDLTSEEALILVNNLIKKRNLGNLYLKSAELQLPNIFTATKSTISPGTGNANTFTFSLASQAAKKVFAAPNAVGGTPSFRSLLISDISDYTVPTTADIPDFAIAVNTLINQNSILNHSDVSTQTLAGSQVMMYNSGNNSWENKVLSTSNITEGTKKFYTDSRARTAIDVTSIGNSGAASYDSLMGIINVPNYTLAGLGGISGITGSMVTSALGFTPFDAANYVGNYWTKTGNDLSYSSGKVTIGISGTTTNTLDVFTQYYVWFGATSGSGSTNSIRFLGQATSGNRATMLMMSPTSSFNNLHYGGGTSLGEPISNHYWFTGALGTQGLGSIRMMLAFDGSLRIGNTASLGNYKLQVTGDQVTQGSGWFTGETGSTGNEATVLNLGKTTSNTPLVSVITNDATSDSLRFHINRFNGYHDFSSNSSKGTVNFATIGQTNNTNAFIRIHDPKSTSANTTIAQVILNSSSPSVFNNVNYLTRGGLSIGTTDTNHGFGLRVETSANGAIHSKGVLRVDTNLIFTGTANIHHGDTFFNIDLSSNKNLFITNGIGKVGVRTGSFVGDADVQIGGSLRQTFVSNALVKTDANGKFIAATATDISSILGSTYTAGNYWTKTGNDLSYTLGRVGIGTTSFNQELNIRGSIYLDSVHSAYNTLISNNVNSNNAFQITQNGHNVISASGDVYTHLILGYASTLKTLLHGKIGIGTTSPLAKTHIVTQSNTGNVSTWGAGNFVVGQDGNTGGISLSYSTTDNTGYISSLSPNIAWRNLGYRANSHIFYTAGTTERLRINSNTGNIGVGVIDPTSELTLKENFALGWRYTSSNPLTAHKITGGGANPIEFTTSYSSAANTKLFSFKGGNGVTAMSMFQSGNVVVGSSTELSSSSKLQVSGNGFFDGAVTVKHTDNAKMFLYGWGLNLDRSASYIRPFHNNTQALYIGDSTTASYWNSIRLNAASLMFPHQANIKVLGTSSGGTLKEATATDISSILGSTYTAGNYWTKTGNDLSYTLGRVGIETTTPLRPLEIFTNTDTYGLAIGDANNSHLLIAGTAQGVNGYSLLQTHTGNGISGGSLSLQRNAGNVLIATATSFGSNYKLQVNGAGYFHSSITQKGVVGNKILKANSIGTLVEATAADITGLLGTDNYIQNGTASQSANFNITGQGTIAGSLYVGGIVEANSGFRISGVNRLSSIGAYTRISDSLGVNRIYLGNAADPNTYYDSPTNHFFRDVSGNYAMVISNSQEVGIGSSSVSASNIRLKPLNMSYMKKGLGIGTVAVSTWLFNVYDSDTNTYMGVSRKSGGTGGVEIGTDDSVIISNWSSVTIPTSTSKFKVATTGGAAMAMFIFGKSSFGASEISNTFKVNIDSGSATGDGLKVAGRIVADDFEMDSDARLKTDIKRIHNAYSDIQKIGSYTYIKDGQLHYGYIAQDFDNVFNHARTAYLNHQGEEYYRIKYNKMIPVNTAAIQAIIKKQTSEATKLELQAAKIKKLQAKVAAMQQELNQLANA